MWLSNSNSNTARTVRLCHSISKSSSFASRSLIHSWTEYPVNPRRNRYVSHHTRWHRQRERSKMLNRFPKMFTTYWNWKGMNFQNKSLELEIKWTTKSIHAFSVILIRCCGPLVCSLPRGKCLASSRTDSGLAGCGFPVKALVKFIQNVHKRWTHRVSSSVGVPNAPRNIHRW